MSFLFLLAGLTLLLAGGHFLVSGGVSLARHFNISTLVVGITVIAFGTSAPELIVSLKANFQDHPDITVGNVIGSNIANIALVLSLTAIVFPIVLQKKSILKDWFAMMGTFAVFVLFSANDTIQWWEGAILVGFLAYYVWSSVSNSRKNDEDSTEAPDYSLWISILIVVGAIAGLSFGADLLVQGAAEIARSFGVSERVISVSLIAFGTSVPELATSLAAAFKRELDISVGNIIGSNIFNILAVVGITASAKAITIPEFFQTYRVDFLAMFGFSILLLLSILPINRGKIDRWKGGVLFLGYIGYIYLIF